MLREFFCSGSLERMALAWWGLAIFFGHACFKSWLKWALNDWYAQFYDELQDAPSAPLETGAAGQLEDFGSDVGSGGAADSAHMAHKRAAIWSQLVQFAWIVAPAVIVHPAAKWIASVWRFSWRMALVRAYLAHYDVSNHPVEGAAQRIHEDTQKFEEGLFACGTIVLDSALTLVVFVPVLLDVGASAHPPGWDWPPWLLSISVAAAVGGLGVSMIVGHKLVGLEVKNQVVEAQFRTKLVLLEQMPAAIVGAQPLDPGAQMIEELHFDDILQRPPRPRPLAPAAAFLPVLGELWRNYRQLFAQFTLFNTWVSLYDQTMTLLPIMLVAPLMFAEDPAQRITLGTLMKVSNAFDKVFGALAIVTENWSSVNEFRSTVRRLREFERATYTRKRFDASLLCDDTRISGAAEPVVRTHVMREMRETQDMELVPPSESRESPNSPTQ